MMVDNLNRSRDRIAAQRRGRLERASVAGDTAVDEGAFRILSNEGLKVIGSAIVSGWLVVTGTLKVVGTLLMEGFLSITGNVTSTGIWNQNGPWNLAGDGGITGDVASTGEWTQSGTYTVNENGKIIVEGSQSITLQSVAGTATLQFSDGPRLWSASSAARMDAGPGKAAVIATTEAAILRSPTSGNAVGVSDTGTRVAGAIFLMDLPTISGVSANVYADPDTGELGMV